MFCPNCGNEIKGNQVFCGVCGTKISDIQFNVVSTNDNIPNSIPNSNPNPTKNKKKNAKKFIIPIVAVVVVISLIIGAFAFLSKKDDKWYIAKQTDIRYNSDGDKESTIITSKRADGQITSIVNINEDDEFSIKYVYDDDGKLIKISFNEDDENIGVFDLTYEIIDGNYVGTADGTVEGDYTSFKRIYNKKNILIYESMTVGSGDEQIINEKEYNDDGLLLKEHNRSRFILGEFNDYITENEYKKGNLLSSSYYKDGNLLSYTEYHSNGKLAVFNDYNDGELFAHTEYDKDGFIVKEESYDDGKLSEYSVVDWGKSKYKVIGSSVAIGEDAIVKCYNSDNKLLLEFCGERNGNTVTMIPKFYDDDLKKEYEEEYADCENGIFAQAVFNDEKLALKVIQGDYSTEYKYDEHGNTTNNRYLSEDRVVSERAYEWAKR